MITNETQCLLQRIRSGFASTLPPNENDLVVATRDDEGTSEYFSGLRWDKIPDDGLVSHYSALWFFTDEAFFYYLPAFMVAALRGADRNCVIWGHIHSQFVGSQRRDKVVAKLSGEQRACLVEFFATFDDNSADL